jgi:hypothetical protein
MTDPYDDPRSDTPCADCGQTFAWKGSRLCGWCDVDQLVETLETAP